MAWLTGWEHRKKITITELAGGAYSDYPTIIPTSYEAAMKNDFSDCRFTEADGETLIPYGIVDKVDGASCNFVIVRSYTVAQVQTVYLYYGNPGAGDASEDHGPWALAWYLANGFGENPSSFSNSTCTSYAHSATEDIPAWAAIAFGGCTANGGYRAWYGRARINAVNQAWASTSVCWGLANAYQLKWKKYYCSDSMYNDAAFVLGGSNYVQWAHYAGGNTGFWVSWYPTDPSISFGEEEPFAEDLPAFFEVGQGSLNLKGEFVVRYGFEHLFAKTDIVQVESLKAVMNIVQWISLPAFFHVGQDSTTLKTEFVIRRSQSKDLPSVLVVDHILDLPAKFTIRHSVPSAIKEAFGPYTALASVPDDLCITYGFQRKAFHAAGRHWIFYVAVNLYYVSRPDDSEIWDAPVSIRSVGSGINAGYTTGMWVEGNYLHYAYCRQTTGEAIYYRKGLLKSDGTIAWVQAEQMAVAGGSSPYFGPNVCVDSEGYPWITWVINVGSGNLRPYITKSSVKNGTWVTAPNYPIVMNTSSSNAAWCITPVPLTNGKVFANYSRSNEDEFIGRVCDPDGIGPEIRIAADLYLDSSQNTVISVGNMAFVSLHDNSARFWIGKMEDETWVSSQIIQTNLAGQGRLAHLAKFGDEILAIWLDTNSKEIKYKKSVDNGVTWTDEEGNPGNTDYSLMLYEPGQIYRGDRAIVSYRKGSALGITWVYTSPHTLRYAYVTTVEAPELKGSFEVGQGSKSLKAEFRVTQETLFAKALITRPGSATLFSSFKIRRPAFQTLFSKMGVAHWKDLRAEFWVHRIYDLSHADGLAFYWWGSDVVDGDQMIDFQMWAPRGGWYTKFPDGEARWRWVFLAFNKDKGGHAVLREFDLAGSRPDKSQIIAMLWNYYTEGVRRLAMITAWKAQEIKGVFKVRHFSNPVDPRLDLKAEFMPIRTAVQELKATFEVGQGFKDLKAEIILIGAGMTLLETFTLQGTTAEIRAPLAGIPVDPANMAQMADMSQTVTGLKQDDIVVLVFDCVLETRQATGLVTPPCYFHLREGSSVLGRNAILELKESSYGEEYQQSLTRVFEAPSDGDYTFSVWWGMYAVSGSDDVKMRNFNGLRTLNIFVYRLVRKTEHFVYSATAPGSQQSQTSYTNMLQLVIGDAEQDDDLIIDFNAMIGKDLAAVDVKFKMTADGATIGLELEEDAAGMPAGNHLISFSRLYEVPSTGSLTIAVAWRADPPVGIATIWDATLTVLLLRR